MNFETLFTADSHICEALSLEGVSNESRYRQVRPAIESELGKLIHILIKVSNAPELKAKYYGVFPRLYKSDLMTYLDDYMENRGYRLNMEDYFTFYRVYLNLSRLDRNVIENPPGEEIAKDDSEIPNIIKEIDEEGNFKLVRMRYRSRGQTPRVSASKKKEHTEWSCIDIQVKLSR